MFANQIKELDIMLEGICDDIDTMEQMLKEKKRELQDVKQAKASLDRIQAKYSKEEEIECEK